MPGSGALCGRRTTPASAPLLYAPVHCKVRQRSTLESTPPPQRAGVSRHLVGMAGDGWGMAGDGWLGMAGDGWLGMAGDGWGWLGMAGDGWGWLGVGGDAGDGSEELCNRLSEYVTDI